MRSHRLRLLGAVGVLAAGLVAAAPAAEVAPLARAPVAARVVQTLSDSVRIEVANHSAHDVRDVRMIVQHAFRWDDEYHPGADNPSRATTHVVSGPVPAGATMIVEHPLEPPLPQRDDGSFESSVEVVHWEEVRISAP
jgi:hypothetical protein